MFWQSSLLLRENFAMRLFHHGPDFAAAGGTRLETVRISEFSEFSSVADGHSRRATQSKFTGGVDANFSGFR